MTHKTLGRAALVSLALGTATIGCTPSMRMDHVASVSDDATKANEVAARAAAKSRAALSAHDGASAVRWAERAVAASPNDADHRLTLGQAYLAAGRFASAEASLRDSLALVPDQPRAAYDLALAQIAQAMPAEALVTLAGVKGRVPDADLGLALALAGDRPNGIAVLTDLVRAGKSDARARQNLALVFALDGQWSQARGLAMQDTAPDRLEAKLSDWSVMAKQPVGARQVAAMLGVAPAPSDPGRPAALALAAPTGKAPVALALAAPVPIAPSIPQTIAAATPLPVVSIPLDAPAVPTPAVEMARLQPATPMPEVPAMLAARPTGSATSPPHLVRVATAHPSREGVAPGPLLRTGSEPGFVVQLGAFARPAALDVAWARAERLSPRFAAFSAVRGTTRHLGGTLVRLSIGGFGTRGDAAGVCTEIKARGGTCFVRGTLGDRPWQWAKKDGETQIAMR